MKVLPPVLIFLALTVVVVYVSTVWYGRTYTPTSDTVATPIPGGPVSTASIHECFPDFVRCGSSRDCASCAGDTPLVCTSVPPGTDVEWNGATARVPDNETYCLPAYLGRCDPYTSTTFLSRDVLGRPVWSCACKPEMAGLFRQSVPGGDCDVQTACGADVPIMENGEPRLFSVYTGDDVAGVPQFDLRPVYANRLVSDQLEPCWYKTTRNALGEIQPADDADPTCHPEMVSPRCVSLAGPNTYQVVRNGAPRVSPLFRRPVPPGLQRCPDGWTGSGTNASPCTNGISSLPAFFTPDDEWALSFPQSLDDLRNYVLPSGTRLGDSGATLPWRGVSTRYASELNCIQEKTFTLNNVYGDGVAPACKDTECTAARGYRYREWDGDRDGSLLDGIRAPFGGTCACEAPGFVRSVDATQPFTCVPDLCPGRYPGAHFDTDGTCSCGPGAMSYQPEGGLPVCVTDACSPLGARHTVQKTCVSDNDCGGVCYNNQCHFATPTACASDVDCENALRGMVGSTQCVEGRCLTLDFARKDTACTLDVECSLGACANGKCTGGCVCLPGSRQVSDGGESPLGFRCESNCEPNPCKNGGTCSIRDGDVVCSCPAVVYDYYNVPVAVTGTRCESTGCAAAYEPCSDSFPCCRSNAYENDYICYGDKVKGTAFCGLDRVWW